MKGMFEKIVWSTHLCDQDKFCTNDVFFKMRVKTSTSEMCFGVKSSLAKEVVAVRDFTVYIYKMYAETKD